MRAWLACVVAVGVMVVGGCSSSAAPEPSDSASAGRQELTAKEYFDAVAAAAPHTSDRPIGSAEGDLSAATTAEYADTFRFRVDVLRVQAWSSATQVTFVVTPEDPDGSFYAAHHLQGVDPAIDGTRNPRPAGGGIRSVALVDPSSGTMYMPVVYDLLTEGKPQGIAHCLCSYVPESRSWNDSTVPWEIPMTAWMGPLPDGTETVTFRMPGVDDITDLPVTWEQS